MSSDSERWRPRADAASSSAVSNLGTAESSSLTSGALPRATHDLISVSNAPRPAPMIGTDDATAGSHAKRAPGQKRVRIALTGSRDADEIAAKAAAKLEAPPRGYTWHHNEDMTMSLVPTDLHRTVEHSGGVAEYKHRAGVEYAD